MTHLDRLSVKANQRVRAGQQVAIVAAGPSSWSSPHVHLGIRNVK
jgi:murein DD-endopeptidase MepM/ murein hydrolase activator NlpD